MEKYRQIDFGYIHGTKDKLLLFADMNEPAIKTIWKRPGEIDIVDYENIEYDYNLPLYAKMIIRFQTSCNKSQNRLHHQIDPCNQHRLRMKYGLVQDKHLVDFFAWIDNSLGPHSIAQLENPAACTQDSEYVTRWRKNSIKFFFWLDENIQKKLLNDYNEQVLEWNNILGFKEESSEEESSEEKSCKKRKLNTSSDNITT